MRTLVRHIFLLVLSIAAAASSLPGCAPATGDSGCVSCHGGLEKASASHHGCRSCHGGNATTRDRSAAHRTLYGGANPSAPEGWEKGCGGCHRYQLERVKSTIMQTNAGMIRNIRLTWEGGEKNGYSADGGAAFNPTGTPGEFLPVEDLDNLAGELYRKACARCHVGSVNTDAYGAVHPSGCAACHFPWNDEGSYQGKDRPLQGKGGHSASHAMSALPDTRTCTRCHSRSGRIGYSYQGLYDGNNSLVPTRRGEPGPEAASGARNLTHIEPDVHFAAGLECIDCHTSRDVMGDGYSYRNMYGQTEVSCENCHGSADAPPVFREINRESDEALRESRSYPAPASLGMRMIQTSKGRSFSNVFSRDRAVWLQGKRTGRLHLCKVITGTPEHTVAGHRRLECYSCHSRTAVQCYGCHTTYDKRGKSRDYLKGEETPGAFSESEDYRMLYPFPLALNQRGRISPVTPGCQTFLTVTEADGGNSRSEYVSRFRGKQQLRFAPFYSHNSGGKAIGCVECHGNPAFLGFGQHVVEGGEIRSTLLCERTEGKPLDGLLTLERGRVRAFSAVTREGGRPLNGKEVKRALSVNLCLTCHSKPSDRIYRKGLDYRALDDALHRRLFTGR